MARRIFLLVVHECGGDLDQALVKIPVLPFFFAPERFQDFMRFEKRLFVEKAHVRMEAGVPDQKSLPYFQRDRS